MAVNRPDLTTKLAKARNQLIKAQAQVAQLEAELSKIELNPVASSMADSDSPQDVDKPLSDNINLQIPFDSNIQKNYSDAIIATDLQFIIQSWNRAAEVIYGWSADEAIGKTLDTLLQTKHGTNEAQQRLRQHLLEVGFWRGDLEQIRKNGSTVQVSGSITRLEDENAAPYGFISVFRDVTKFEVQERDLPYHASLQENVSDAVIVTNMEFQIQSWNKAAERIYGWHTAEVVGKTPAEILGTQFTQETRERSIQQLREEGWWQGEVIQHHKDGHTIYILGSVNVIKDETGIPLSIISVNHDFSETKLAQDNLQKSSAEIHNLYNNAPCGYHSIDKNGLFVQMNDTELRWLGYTRDEVIGKLKITDFFTPAGIQLFQKQFPLFMTNGKVHGLAIDVIRKDGSLLPIILNSTAVYDENGQFLHSNSTIFDISELKQTQQALAVSEQRLKLLFNSIQDYAILMLDVEGKIVSWNPGAESIKGYKAEEIIGRPLSVFYTKDDNAKNESQRVLKIAEQEGRYIGEGWRVRKDGSLFWASLVLAAIRDANGQLIGFTKVTRDLTERKHAETALTESEARYRLLAENVTDVIIKTDEAGIRTFVTLSSYNLLGYTPEELLGRSRFEIMHPQDRPRIEAEVREAISSGKSHFSITQRVQHKEGHYIWIEATNSIVRNSNTHDFIEIIAVMRDITERKRAEEILQQSEERFALVFRFSPVAIGLTTVAEGQYLDVNDSLLKLLGYSREEMIGRTVSELNIWAIPEERNAAVEMIREKGSVRGMEFGFRQKNGEICLTLTSIVPVMLNGQSCLLSIVHDITERKRAEKILQSKMEEEHELQNNLKALHEIVIELTAIEQLDTFYKRTVELGRERLGFERFAMFLYDEQTGSAIGTFGTDIQGNVVDERGVRFTPDPNGIMRLSFDRAERFYFNEQTILYNDEIPVGDGWNAAAVLCNGTRNLGWLVADNLLSHTPASKPLLDTIGLYALSVGTLLAQKQTQRALRESENLYRLMAENISDLIMSSTLTGECLYVSPSVQTLLGYTDKEFIGQSTFNFIHADDQETIWNAYASALEHHDAIMPHRARVRHKNGHYVWLETVGRPIFAEESGEMMGLITSSRDITARMQVEEALRESEEKFRLLLDAAPIATVISDKQGRIVLINEQAENLFGYKRTELIGQIIEILVPDYAHNTHVNNRMSYIESPRVREMGHGIELFAKRKNASQFPVEIELSYIETKDGMMVMSFVVDITERKRIAAELERQRIFLRQVIDVSPNLIFVKDYDSRFVLANTMVAELYNMPAEALIGKRTSDFTKTPTAIDGFLEVDRQVINSGQPLHIEEPITNYAGETRWFQTTKVPITSADGQTKYVLGVATDISERKQNEAALKESEAKYRSLIDTMQGGMVIFDMNYRITYVNDRFCELLGYSREETIGKTPVDFIDEANLPQLQSQMERRQNAESTSYEMVARHKSGKLVYLLIAGSPLFDQMGQYMGSFAVATDITIQKQAETQLRQALAKEKELGELKSRFVSMASHEFRTPLATIHAMTDTLRAYRHKLQDEEIEERLIKIQDQIGYLTAIMDDVLLLARMQARRVEFNPTKLNLDSLCVSVLDEFQSRPDVTQELIYTCDNQLLEVTLDKKLMRQIINNLVSNAIKYSPPKSLIRIKLENERNTVVLTIQDQGIGIPEEDLKHLFEPFHRARNVGAISGTGLGLVIIKESIELHNGTITVDSQVGVGTTFKVSIPLIK